MADVKHRETAENHRETAEHAEPETDGADAGAPTQPTRAETVVIIGGSTPLGHRVTDLVATDPSVTRMVVVELEAAGPALAPAIAPAVLALEASRTTAVERVTLAASADLRPLLAGATAVLSLGWAGLGLDLDPAAAAHIVPSAKRVLAAAAADPPDLLVMISSATVYGAWPTNPVPLTEDAAIKPNPGFEPAAALAEVERLAVEWAEEHPMTATAVLRPVTTVAPDRPGWLARALRSALGFPVEDHDPPTQFLQLDDLAAAVDAVRRTRPRGALNVAPDGWLNGPDRRALDVRPRLRLPAAMAGRVHAWRWRLGLAPTPPTLLPYAVHPWVVANDALRSTGWEPKFTNEEAWVAGHPAGPLATLSPQRRQELILGAAVAVAIGGTAFGVRAFRRRRR